jgi:pyridoxal phosphate enzyme (YggS family)
VPEQPQAVAERYLKVRQQVVQAALESGRAPDTVLLLAVGKRMPIELLRAAHDAGARDFGENYVQEALAKVDGLPLDARWHLIGHLQSNKAKRAVEAFHSIHTLDRPSLAAALEKELATRQAQLEVLLQVNVGGEDSKSGTTPEGAVALARRMAEWPHLRLRGLMTIPPYHPDPERTRPQFRALRQLRDQIAALGLPGVEMHQLSMGMSHDYPVAVQEGATIVRVGTAIFGERSP